MTASVHADAASVADGGGERESTSPPAVAVVGGAGFGSEALVMLLCNAGEFAARLLTGKPAAISRALRQHHHAAAVVTADAVDLHKASKQVQVLRNEAPATAIVVIVPSEDPVLVRDLFREGVSACLTESADTDSLFTAVRQALAGERYLCPRLSVAIAEFGDVNGPADLSVREKEVLRWIALGLTNREIAQAMHLSVRTIEYHRASMQQKLGTVRRATLVRRAKDLGLVG